MPVKTAAIGKHTAKTLLTWRWRKTLKPTIECGDGAATRLCRSTSRRCMRSSFRALSSRRSASFSSRSRTPSMRSSAFCLLSSRTPSMSPGGCCCCCCCCAARAALLEGARAACNGSTFALGASASTAPPAPSAASTTRASAAELAWKSAAASTVCTIIAARCGAAPAGKLPGRCGCATRPCACAPANRKFEEPLASTDAAARPDDVPLRRGCWKPL
mmetsp:Transcript_125100/g.361926  ORF Transcript_125100/g.361926 Transcript_125100/m.361926 type:complete len:217 (-) Transcript_125100:333-983(-)